LRFADVGAPVDTTFAHTVVEGEDVAYRYMRPIYIAKPVCLKCHGPVDTIDAELRDRIAERYPDDRATGYRFRELRGAFSVTIPVAAIEAGDAR
jgi:hypothetical protein